MKHKHHIIPRYDGGTDDSNNLVTLTPTQHSMWHYAEWLRKRDYRDYCAYKMILGDVNNPEFRAARNKAFHHTIQEGGRKWREKNPHKLTENGIKGNKAQRDKLKQQGKTIAEKSWLITFDDGREESVTNLAKWCVENNYNKCHLSAISKGKRNYHKDIISVKKTS